MELIDTHSHIYLRDFRNDIDEVVSRALKNSVKKILLPNIDSGSVIPLHALCDSYPDVCYPMMGLHPRSVKENYKDELKKLWKQLEKREYIAIGEIGIDLYWDRTFIKEQRYVFEKQVEYAVENEMPVIIHARESFGEIFGILDRFGELPGGIFHAFTGNQEQADRAIEIGFKLGIGGIVTFKNSGLDRVVKHIDLKHIVLETDSPYLTPVPYRGKRNESSYLIHIAEKIAEIHSVSLDEVSTYTTRSVYELFYRLEKKEN
jgi:TatD DNase family protein